MEDNSSLRSSPISRHLPFGEKRDSRFYGQHILTVAQFDKTDLATIFEVAQEMRAMVQRVGSFDLLKGKVLTNLFYEPSTRTCASAGTSVAPITNPMLSCCDHAGARRATCM